MIAVLYFSQSNLQDTNNILKFAEKSEQKNFYNNAKAILRRSILLFDIAQYY